MKSMMVRLMHMKACKKIFNLEVPMSAAEGSPPKENWTTKNGGVPGGMPNTKNCYTHSSNKLYHQWPHDLTIPPAEARAVYFVVHPQTFCPSEMKIIGSDFHYNPCAS